eukprot:gnl/MRDRNA2_/MRDRNA2_111670_c0_seq1.p1 gnl/MRDRNA2_/MRDRNA2_111670_c0~~gnl/MRDRNA2_/MRDRNA2_111670_c0_seq1.p1  ORF type:complete len:271 (+),score=75.49 gnl/MRDRNA2_/MRDRNA2_111670_c0_seq1:117-929(+)
MANSMIGVVAFCLVASISGDAGVNEIEIIKDVGRMSLNKDTTVMDDVTGDQDFHTDAVVAPREDRFSKTTGKKLKSKFKSTKSAEEWKPKNIVSVVSKAVETSAEKEQRLFAEFADAWKRKQENRVYLSAELDGLDNFAQKVNRARNWNEMQKAIDDLGEVGQTTFRQNPGLREQLMVPQKKARQEAAKKFLEATEKVKETVLSEKMRLHAEWMSGSSGQWMDAWKDENADKARRLSEYDESVKRRQMRGVPRRPLGDGEDLPNPDSKDL